MHSLDALAYTNPWRLRHPAEKAVLALGLLGCAVALPPWPGLWLSGRWPWPCCSGRSPCVPARSCARCGHRWCSWPSARSRCCSPSGTRRWCVSTRRGSRPRWRSPAGPRPRCCAWSCSPRRHRWPTPCPGSSGSGCRSRSPRSPRWSTGGCSSYSRRSRPCGRRRRAGSGSAPGARPTRSVAGQAGAVFVGSFDRARRLEQGLVLRGYSGSLRVQVEARPVSRPFVAGSVALLVAVVGLTLALA